MVAGLEGTLENSVSEYVKSSEFRKIFERSIKGLNGNVFDIERLDLSSYSIEPIKDRFLMNALGRIITLKKGDSAVKIFAKLKYPFLGRYEERLQEILNRYQNHDLSKEEGRKLYRDVNVFFKKIKQIGEHEEGHMRFWNRQKMYAPIYLGRISEDVSVSYSGRTELLQRIGKSNFPIEGSFTTFISGPTHDRDLLAIEQRIVQNEKEIKERLTIPERKDQLIEANRSLKSIREDILLSISYTMSHMALLGTRKMGSAESPQIVDSWFSKSDAGKNLSHLFMHFSKARKWEKERADQNSEDLPYVNGVGVHPEIMDQDLYYRFKEVFGDSFDRLEKDMFKMYHQADEHGPHYAYLRDLLITEGELRSVVIDADRCVMTSPEIKFAKVMTGYMLYSGRVVKLDERYNYFKKSLDQEKKVVAKRIEEERNVGVSGLIRKKTRDSFVRFNEWSVIECLSVIGKFAKTDLNPISRAMAYKVADIKEEYKNDLIVFPNEDPMSTVYENYRPKKAIDILRRNLDSMLDELVQDHSGRNELKFQKMRNFLKKEYIELR